MKQKTINDIVKRSKVQEGPAHFFYGSPELEIRVFLEK